MNKTITIFLILLCFFSFGYSQSNRIMPTTLDEMFIQLDYLYPIDDIGLRNLTFDSFFWQYRNTIGSRISRYILNPLLMENINPNNWRIHKESYMPILMEAYWSYLNGLDYDLDLRFECDDRYLKSGDEPKSFPKENLVRDSKYFSVKYLYKNQTCSEVVYRYRTGTDNLIYFYSLHFGWIVLTEEEFSSLTYPEYNDAFLEFFSTREKLVF